jgi:ankyrin repeat protein
MKKGAVHPISRRTYNSKNHSTDENNIVGSLYKAMFDNGVKKQMCLKIIGDVGLTLSAKSLDLYRRKIEDNVIPVDHSRKTGRTKEMTP